MRIKIGIALFVLANSASPAAALQRIATYTGTVTSGIDRTGVFTAPGTNLAGMMFTATYRYDTSAGVRQTTVGNSDAITYYSYPAPTSDLLASLSINGRNFGFATSSGFAIISSVFVTHKIEQFASENPQRFFFLDNAVEAAIANPNLDAELDAYDPGTGLGGFEISFDTNSPAAVEGQFGNAHVSITGTVSEPATWALMLTGFGVVGVGVRRSRQPRRQQPA